MDAMLKNKTRRIICRDHNGFVCFIYIYSIVMKRTILLTCNLHFDGFDEDVEKDGGLKFSASLPSIQTFEVRICVINLMFFGYVVICEL